MDKKDLAQDKKMMAGAVHKHERAKHKGQPLTPFKKGGPTSMSMRSMGRNMARARNQGSR